MKWMFVFGLLIIGNIIDNMSYIKPVVILLHVYLGLMWISTGYRVYQGTKKDDCDSLPLERVGIIDQFPASGLMLINIVQIFN